MPPPSAALRASLNLVVPDMFDIGVLAPPLFLSKAKRRFFMSACSDSILPTRESILLTLNAKTGLLASSDTYLRRRIHLVAYDLICLSLGALELRLGARQMLIMQLMQLLGDLELDSLFI